MRDHARVAVVIPALNEAAALPAVLRAIPEWVDQVIVADNGSTDATAAIAAHMGAVVVAEPRRGYGAACQRGLTMLEEAQVVVFLDADYSDDAAEMARLVDPILQDEADLVIGSRVLGRAEAGALTIPQRLGNRLACGLMRVFWGGRFTDLGPFRAIRRVSLEGLGMRDEGFGWTVEMQIRALQRALRVREVPVDYRRRIGRSKISGTVRGTIGAGTKILLVIGACAVEARFGRGR